MLTIRREQMEVLSAYMRQSFEDRMVKHIAGAFPQEHAALLDAQAGDGKLRALIRNSSARAASYQIRSERDVARFVEVTVAVDPHFEDLPDMVWARDILRDATLSGEDKMWLIYDRLVRERSTTETEEK